jgi:hypothetical protein
MYWQFTTREALAARREKLAAEERAKARREASTLDFVAVGEQQSEVEHDFAGERVATGLHNGRRWRHGEWFQYSLATRGEKAVELSVTYWGGDQGRTFDILANGERLATETLNNNQPGQFFEKRYRIPEAVLAKTANGRVIIRFAAKPGALAGGVFDVRLMKPESP